MYRSAPQALNRESVEGFFSGRKILIICLVLLAIFLAADTAIRLMSVAAVTAVQTSETPTGTLKISPGGRERIEVLPPSSMDARWWVIHTENYLRGNSLRVRHTDLDNAPLGREVHWSSSLIWLLSAMAGLLSAATGKPAVECVAQASLWAGPLLLVGCLLGLGLMTARRFGAALAGVFLLIFGSSPQIFQGFRAAETDHHGLVCALATGCVLALVAGGGGLIRRNGKKDREWPSRDAARRWFLLSGILGGAALWVSAASFIPILMGCAIGALALTFVFIRRPVDGWMLAPELWRAWGQAGCASSLFFYALEYFPNHMGWRLEVNHPLYALAWLGAGDLLARLLGKIEAATARSPSQKKPLKAASPFAFAASLLALAAPVVLIVANPQGYFWVSDRFLSLLHNEYILEFRTFLECLKAGEEPPLMTVIEVLGWPLLVLGGWGWLAWRGALAREWQALLVLAVAPALVMQVLALYQIRWNIMATGMWTVGILVLLAGYGQAKAPVRGFAILAGTWIVAASLAFPLIALFALSQAANLREHLPKIVIPTILLRDVSHRLVQSSPDRLPVVLSGPTSSTDLTYYGGIKTVGTLYWENREGLSHAARLFDAQGEEETRRLLLDAGVTHLVVSSWDDFGRGYAHLLRRSEGREEGKDGGYLERILREAENPPDWLRPLSYPIPAGFGIEGQWVKIFQVIPSQSRADALINRAVYYLDSGETDKARTLLEEALVIEPGNQNVRQWLESIHPAEQKSPQGTFR